MKIKLQHFSVLCSLFSVLCFSQTPEPEFAWVKRFGTASSAHRAVNAPVIGIDEQGNSYVSGTFYSNTFNIDGIALTSPLTLPSSSYNSGYIAKYNSQGQIIWAKSMLNISPYSASYYNKIIIDKVGNIYLCATYSTTAHSIISGHYLTNPDEQLGNIPNKKAYFIVKLDADGNVLWTQASVTPLVYGISLNFADSNEIYFDLDGNINMTGVFTESITFSSNDTLITDTNEAGVFLMKYSPDGEVIVAKKLEGTYPRGHYQIEKVRADASGNLYRLSSQDSNNPKTLYRYDATGELIESIPIDVYTTGNLQQTGVRLFGFDVSPVGDVFIGGSYKGPLYLDGSVYPYTVFQQGVGYDSGVIFKLSASDYSVEWVNTINIATLHTTFRGIVTDPLGNVYVSGTNNNIGQSWLLLKKLDTDGDLIWEKEVKGLITPQTPNVNIINSTGVAQSQNGGNIWLTGDFDANIYFGEGYHFTVPYNNSYGPHYNGFLVQYGLCDTENPFITEPVSTQLCEGESLTLSAELPDTELTYFWSTPTGTITIEETGTATLTVTQPGQYYLVAQADEECYGKSQEVWVTQVATLSDEVVQEEQTLTATENTENTTYQWVDCDNGNYPVEGATAQSFTPSVSGSYAVEVTNASGCSVVSECYNVSVMSIKDIEQNAVVLYPNPATTMLYLETPQQIKRITIINMAGKTVLKNRNSKEIDVSALAQGYYIITAKTDKGTWKSKFVKK